MLDNKEEEKDLHQLTRQIELEKDELQFSITKHRDRNVLMSEEIVLRRLKKYFKEPNNKEMRVKGMNKGKLAN